MPALKNTKHERFAICRVQGMTADAAYVSAGYAENRGHASRLDSNGSVRARIAELQEQAARAAIQAIAYDAKSLFARLENQIALALADKEHRVAMDGRQFMIECFGYHDSPTLTHEHIADRVIVTTPAAPPRPNDDPGTTYFPPASMPRFAEAIAKVRRRLAS